MPRIRWVRVLARVLVVTWCCSFLAVPAFSAVGRTAGSFDVSQSGQASYSIPIFAPPGTNGLTPQLALAYDHGSSNTLLGVGWNIAGLSTLRRCPRTWVQDGESRDVRNDASDRFCLDGNKLRLTGGTYGSAGSTYQTEIERFSRVTAYGTAGNGPAYFIVEGKDGLLREFGNTVDSRIESVGQSTARAWALNKIRDRSGNAIVFNYTEDATNGSYRIATIQYTSNPGQGVSASHTIEFAYETKPANEIDSGYLAGSVIKQITRLNYIDVKYGATILRHYELTYEAALSSTSKSRLASVQECAGSPLDCFPATTFSYQNGTSGLASEVNTGNSVLAQTPWPLDLNGDGRDDLVYSSSLTSGSGTWRVMLANASGGYHSPVNTGIVNTNWGGAIPIDYNADGLEDVLVPYSGGTWWVMYGTSSGLAAPANTGAPATATGTGLNARAMDIDGDGLQDLVWADLVGSAGGDAIRYRLRVWGGAFSATAYTLVGPLPANYWIASQTFFPWGAKSPYRLPDFNGDARGELLYRLTYQEYDPETQQWFYTRTLEVVSPGAWNFSQPVGSLSTAPFYGDFNGDNKTDILYVDGSQWRYRFSRGTSFASQQNGPTTSGYGEMVILDWDSDGYDDVLMQHTASGLWYLVRSNGEQLLAAVSTGVPFGSGSNDSTIADIDGNGLHDLAYNLGGTWRFRTRAGSYPDLLTTATDGFGVSVTFNYAPLTNANYSKYADAVFPEQDYQGPLYVVNSLSASNGIGGTYTNNFWYYGARVHLQGRGFEGFYAKRTHDTRNNLYAYDYFNRLFPYTGTGFQSDLYQPDASTLITRTQNTWTAHSYGTGFEARRLPFISNSTSTQREVGGAYNGTLIRTVATTASVDTWGMSFDVTTTTTENATGLSTGATHTQRVWHSSVTNDSGPNWCLNKPTTTQMINSHSLAGGGAITRTVNRTWDYVNCRPTQEVLEPGSGQWQVTTDLGYDVFGNVNSQTVTPVGQAARVTSAFWGTDGRFPLTITNPLSQTTTNTWIADLGLLDTLTDPNSLTVNLDYDVFGRKVRELRPDGTATRWELSACTSPSYCGDSLLRSSVRESLRNTADAIVADRYVYRDLFDREKYNESRTLAGSLSFVRTFYDALGRVSSRSVPYINGSDPYEAVNYTYDLLNRLTREEREVSEADASLLSMQRTFNGLTVIETNALSQQTTKKFTAIGQVAQVIDAAGSDTDYEYSAFGDLLKTRDFSGNEITLGYNVRGFKTSQADPDLGNWTYDYFPWGELKRQTNAKSQNLDFTYDKLSRPLTRIEPEGTTSWTWGTSAASKNIGQLASVSSPGSYSESYTYDGFGRPSQSSIIADGTTYLVNQGYNASTGFLETLTYPTSTSGVRFKVKYAYQNGHVRTIHDFTGEVQTTKLWEGISTNARHSVIDEEFGNGLKTFSKYDHIAGWLDYRQTAPGGGSTTQYLNYAWDRLGNLTQRKDENQVLTENFTYDNLNRLQAISGVSSATLAYNAIGNITSKTAVGTYNYTTAQAGCTYYSHIQPHAVRNTGGVVHCYDANGNMSSRGGASLSWTSYNLPSLINQSGGNSSQFSYGADRQRYKQVNVNLGTTETTIYVAGLLEKFTLGTITTFKHFVHGPEGTVAIRTRNTSGVNSTYYPLKDHLGSFDRLTNSAGAVVVALSYDAFGKRRGSNWTGNPSSPDWSNIVATTHRGFTEHEHLDNLLLIHMNGRVYDPHRARFLSADPFVTEPSNSQSFNRYSYVHNNPLSFTDPSGYDRRNCEYGCPGGAASGTDWLFVTNSRIVSSAGTGNSPARAPRDAAERDANGVPQETNEIDGSVSCDLPATPGINPVGGDACGAADNGILGAASRAAVFAVPGWGAAQEADRAWEEGRYGLYAGWMVLGTGEVFLSVVTLGGSVALLTSERVAVGAAARAGAGASEAFHYTFSRALASIRSQGLRPGSYATPNGTLSPLQAQIDLALAPNRGLANALVRVDLAGLRQAGYQIPEITRVGRSAGMPGGGFEMQFPYPIPPQFLTVIGP